ncbi:16S rRNA (guanine(527)-N(7))-methyltransferase RsmG [Sphingomonas mesophila]|uniref:16S rRNA (guanine(527)-N(7))-methyltransferase RsmG n=1 Tax=Sphingomonas mesophila TaxID=2303576 RepID=UPI000E5882B7|nr:16S rRNA (guanine(527)-N(7))-methyltransferase RsmG [Sphingomonas mesophila]
MNVIDGVSRETCDQLERYVDLLLEESRSQNLIASSTIEDVWSRHIADSAQLAPLAAAGSRWADIGSGAGLPGIVLAIVNKDPILLIEPRRKRADFLMSVISELSLDNAEVFCGKAQNATGRFDVITARAVADAGALLAMSLHLAHEDTKFLLMKGRGAQSELEQVQRTWQGEFRLVASRTAPDAAIIVAEGVRRRGRA